MRSVQDGSRILWNRGQIIGPKPPLKPKHIWTIRTRLQLARRVRDLAMFNLAFDSKLRGCDLGSLKVSDVQQGDGIRARSTVIQQKTGSPVPFEITDPTREALVGWIGSRGLTSRDRLFPSRSRTGEHITTAVWTLGRRVVTLIGLDPSAYGTHSMRRTKVALVYKRTGNLRAARSHQARKHGSLSRHRSR